MKTRIEMVIMAVGLLWVSGLAAGEEKAADSGETAKEVILPKTQVEARIRAKILHDTIHATLQFVHRDFFDPLEMDLIPSATLSEVFSEVEEDWKIEIRWLGVEGKTMNADHKPKDRFEKKAVEELAAGKAEFDAMEGRFYRRAAPIVLHNACLKCHVPNRTSLEDRVAGLVISMPLAREKEGEKK